MNNKKLKMLIAEDEDDILVLYRDYFRSMGHKVDRIFILGVFAIIASFSFKYKVQIIFYNMYFNE